MSFTHYTLVGHFPVGAAHPARCPVTARRTVLFSLSAVVLVLGCHKTVAPPDVAPLAVERTRDRLAPPVLLEADGKPLVDGGSFGDIFLGDIDGDGRPDLLVGSGPHGRLLVYRNVGTRAAPRLAGPQWFDEQVPTGRTPAG